MLSVVSVSVWVCAFRISKIHVSGSCSPTHTYCVYEQICTHTILEIAALYLNEYSQCQCLINVPAFCQLQAAKQNNTLNGWIKQLEACSYSKSKPAEAITIRANGTY